MSSCCNVCLFVWRRLLLQTLRRHYVATALEFSFVACIFATLYYDRVELSRVKKLNRSFVEVPRPSPADVDSIRRTVGHSLTVVYGPSDNYTDTLITTMLSSIRRYQHGGDEPEPWDLEAPPDSKQSVSEAPPLRRGHKRVPLPESAAVADACRVVKQQGWSAVDEVPICVEFESWPKDTDSSKGLAYSLVMFIPPDVTFPTGIIYEVKDIFTDFDTIATVRTLETLLKTTYGYQALIDDAHMTLQGGPIDTYGLYADPFPVVTPVEDIQNYRNAFFGVLSVGFCLPLVWRIRDVTTEIGSGLKELQEIMGLSSSQFWLGHFLSALPIALVEAALACYAVLIQAKPYEEEAKWSRPSSSSHQQYIRVYSGNPETTRFFENADASLVALPFALFTVCHTLMALLVACVCPFGGWAVVVGFGLFFLLPACDGDKLGFIFEYSLFTYIVRSRADKLRTAFFYPNVAFSTLIKIVGMFDDFETVVITTTENNEKALSKERFQALPDLEAVIKCDGLVKIYDKTVALNKVDMTIHKSQVTVLLGHNGAGKTTLMSIFTGLQKADSGTVTISGRRITSGACQKSTGFCPQLDSHFCDLTVSDHLTYFGLLRGLELSTIQRNITRVLKSVQLYNKIHAFPHELSGGMKRKLSIAIALITRPQVLILDEPTVGMDPETRRVIWTLVQSLRGNTTVLLSTHDMEEAEALGDRIIVMYGGSVVCWGSPSFLKNACGVGYKLRLSKIQTAFEADKVLAVAKKASPLAVVEEDKETEAVVALNTLKREGFVAMFKDLEDKGAALGIQSVGVTVATMKDAYIK